MFYSIEARTLLVCITSVALWPSDLWTSQIVGQSWIWWNQGQADVSPTDGRRQRVDVRYDDC